MPVPIRAYDPGDVDDIARIWREIGWIEGGTPHRAGLEAYLSVGATEVAIVEGSVESMAHRTPGTIRYEGTELPFCGVTGVATSHVARKLGLARRLTARALRNARDEGAAVAGLGIFEQGFYDLVGFGLSSYDHLVHFDPASLRLDHVPYRPPARITVDDAAEFHRAMVDRMPAHGGVCFEPPALVEAEMRWCDNLVGLGYRDADGRLTHGFFGSAKDEHGPLHVNFVAYRSVPELLEVLRSIRELGDQFHTVRLIEPAHIQVQSLLDQPMRQRSRSAGSPHESGIRSEAWTQLRVLDVGALVAARSWAGPPVEFTLDLDDPAAHAEWTGAGGTYAVRLGEESSAAAVDHAGDGPAVRCGVGTFTRLWFGVESASTLAATEGLDAPPDLLATLDDAFVLPPVRAGWDY
mgnify:CR=1 FL=1